jgi:hypothetical protein
VNSFHKSNGSEFYIGSRIGAGALIFHDRENGNFLYNLCSDKCRLNVFVFNVGTIAFSPVYKKIAFPFVQIHAYE